MQKTIKINPELFRLGKSSKLNKKKSLKNDKNIDSKLNLQSNKVKQKLLEKVKEYQKNRQGKNLTTNNNNNFHQEVNNFSDSLNFLENLSNEHQKKSHQNSQTSHLVQSHEHNKSLKFKRNDIENNNIAVNLELPKELINIETVNIDSINNANTSTKTNRTNNSSKSYGCLKNGQLPTYREWKRSTQKNINRDSKLSFNINTELNTFSDPPNYREQKLNDIKKMYKESNPIQDILPPSIQSPVSSPVSSHVSSPVYSPVSTNNMPIVFNIPDTMPNSDLETQISKTKLQMVNPQNISNNSSNDSSNDSLNDSLNELIEFNLDNTLDNMVDNNIGNINEINMMNKIPKIIRNTKTYKYNVGKSKKTNSIGIFIKNRNTLKNIKKDFKKLRDVDINEVKNYLRKHNIIKSGTNAPNDVLRELYEKMILAGDITNDSTGNLVYNFINE